MSLSKDAVQPTASAPTTPAPPKRGERNPVEPLVSLAISLRALPWAEMAQIAEHIAGEYEHLRKADKVDRDGVAQVLADMADEILKEADMRRAATISAETQ